MKKYILSLIMLISLIEGYSQGTVRASIGAAGNPSNIRIYLRPDITNPAVAISTLNFNVALPASITPIPTLSVVTNNIVGTTWVIDPPYIEAGFIHYNLGNAQAGYTIPCTAGADFMALELSFTGGPAGTFANAAQLVCLPDGGGGNGLALFYCTSAVANVLNSNGQSLYYARDAAVTIANGDSYRFTGSRTGVDAPQGTFTSFARLITGITLPVKFASFFAYKQNNDGLLNWNVENQTLEVRYFEVERSFDGVSFTKIKTQNPLTPTNGFVSYNLTDPGVFDTYKGTVYYRIKQIDFNGAITYSPVRSIKADSKAFGLNIYPNPVKDKANVVFTLDKAEAVTVTLVDVNGKRIADYSVQAQKGINQKQIDMSSIAAGTYSFRLTTKNEIQNISFVKSN